MCVVQKHLSFTSATAEGSTRTVSSTKGPTERGDSRLKTQDSRLKEREEDARGPCPHGGPAPTGRRKRKPPAGRAKAGVAPGGSTHNAGARRRPAATPPAPPPGAVQPLGAATQGPAG